MQPPDSPEAAFVATLSEPTDPVARAVNEYAWLCEMNAARKAGDVDAARFCEAVLRAKPGAWRPKVGNSYPPRG